MKENTENPLGKHTATGQQKGGRLGLVFLIALCVAVVALWVANWVFLVWFGGTPEQRGQFGDMFGAVNALFTALAFAGLIYTVLLQRDQLALQQQEIIESGKTQERLVQRQIDSQNTLFDKQKAFQEEQRQKQMNHELKLEDLRQQFEELVEGHRKDREQRYRDEFAKNVSRAIRCELEALAMLYEKGMGDRLRTHKEGEILNVRFVLTEKWMTVFDANAIHLGSLEAGRARKIISVYALLKGLIEEYRINNDYITELTKLEIARRQTSTDEFIRSRHEGLLEQMRAQATDIVKADAALKAAYQELLREMDSR